MAHVLDTAYQHLSHHRSVEKLFKEVFNLRSLFPKLSFVWYVQIMFDYFIQLRVNVQLSDKHLPLKLLILLLLLGGKRLNSIFHFTVDRTIFSSNTVTFLPEHVLKHSRPGKKLYTFEYRAYSDRKLCILGCLKEYLRRRKKTVSNAERKLFITIKEPFHAASTDFMRRQLRQVFSEAKLIEKSLPHGCRSPSTTEGLDMNLDISDILKIGC